MGIFVRNPSPAQRSGCVGTSDNFNPAIPLNNTGRSASRHSRPAASPGRWFARHKDTTRRRSPGRHHRTARGWRSPRRVRAATRRVAKAGRTMRALRRRRSMAARNRAAGDALQYRSQLIHLSPGRNDAGTDQARKQGGQRTVHHAFGDDEQRHGEQQSSIDPKVHQQRFAAI